MTELRGVKVLSIACVNVTHDQIDCSHLPPKERCDGCRCPVCHGDGEIEMQPSTNVRPCPECGGE